MVKKPIARVGDVHVCPKHGTNAIISGANTIMINSKPVARVGDKTACGATILTGASSLFGQGSLVAYMGSTTSHGGVITTGSPNAFVWVEVEAVEAKTVESEGFGKDDAASLALDVIPIIGTIKGLIQIVVGKDLVTRETLGRGTEALGTLAGIIPGGKGVFKAGKSAKEALKSSRSSSEALGKAGMEQAKKRQGLKTDPKYTDRYHGPDDLARDKNGKLTEIEAKGNNKDSKAVATNKNKERQSSAKKNKRRAEQMVDQKTKKISIPSNRQGGVYTQDEIDLWDEIKERDGNKRHLSVHTNTKTGRVQVLDRDSKGKNPQTIDDFKMENFDEIKQGIEEAFKK